MDALYGGVGGEISEEEVKVGLECGVWFVFKGICAGMRIVNWWCFTETEEGGKEVEWKRGLGIRHFGLHLVLLAQWDTLTMFITVWLFVRSFVWGIAQLMWSDPSIWSLGKMKIEAL